MAPSTSARLCGAVRLRRSLTRPFFLVRRCAMRAPVRKCSSTAILFIEFPPPSPYLDSICFISWIIFEARQALCIGFFGPFLFDGSGYLNPPISLVGENSINSMLDFLATEAEYPRAPAIDFACISSARDSSHRLFFVCRWVENSMSSGSSPLKRTHPLH